ncbi:phosphoadenylyl-sulfate reductase [archaeon]|nr:phosphoadenylyl-sulfate reductase [archaeon]|tara:strand:- start:1468 stop:2202 length:735 start_codon:yes stop_codon:yes gene_type:complete
MDEQYIKKLQEATLDFSVEEFLQKMYQEFGSGLVLVTGFGASGVVIIDMVARLKLPITIVSVDTGRLPEETYTLMEKIQEKYGKIVQLQFPDREEVQSLVGRKGVFSFRKGLKDRKECCRVRKVLPLKRILSGYKAWISGVRKDQSVTRLGANRLELDIQRGRIVKCNPLVNWTEKQVWEYIKKFDVPFNSLYENGFKSIGCAPCTRAVREGEDIRGGRWWWEDASQKECGIHGYCEISKQDKP